MHDRRIDGETHVFGNAGALFMGAMTWYDHKTGSIWSQPWGRGIEGEYKGVQLGLLPSQVTTWGSWRRAHPSTLVMTNDTDRTTFRQGFDPRFVVGLILSEDAKAFYFEDIAASGVINDTLGTIPIVVWATADAYGAFIRRVGDQTLTFTLQERRLLDAETRTEWDPLRGIALSGPLEGEALRQIPNTTAFDWAWIDFYPDSAFYLP